MQARATQPEFIRVLLALAAIVVIVSGTVITVVSRTLLEAKAKRAMVEERVREVHDASDHISTANIQADRFIRRLSDRAEPAPTPDDLAAVEARLRKAEVVERMLGSASSPGPVANTAEALLSEIIPCVATRFEVDAVSQLGEARLVAALNKVDTVATHADSIEGKLKLKSAGLIRGLRSGGDAGRELSLLISVAGQLGADTKLLQTLAVELRSGVSPDVIEDLRENRLPPAMEQALSSLDRIEHFLPDDAARMRQELEVLTSILVGGNMERDGGSRTVPMREGSLIELRVREARSHGELEGRLADARLALVRHDLHRETLLRSAEGVLLDALRETQVALDHAWSTVIVSTVLGAFIIGVLSWRLPRVIRQELERQTAAERRLAEEFRAARDAAEAANRTKSAFLANMSHEIRTPLTAILGFTDLLREDGNLAAAPERRVQAIDTIRNAGQHLLTVINDILDLSKIEADKMTVERIETPLVGVLHEVESLMRSRAAGKGLSLCFEFSTPVPEFIISDPTRLRQILLNLAGNAVKFTEVGGVTIIAGAGEVDGAARLVIDVDDTGPGMTGEQAARLFQAFGQADETMTRKFGGTGLGLTICRRLASLMGGEVKLVRTEPNKGSCFRLVLPLEAAPGAAMIERCEAVAAPKLFEQEPVAVELLRGKVLLAEDGPDNQRLIVFHLRKAGATVEVADNGQIALEMLEKAQAEGTPFDLLLTDVQMPQMDGYTLARTLRQRGSTLPIVALTAHAMAEDRKACLDAGCDDYASKPIDRARLIATCAEWINKHARASEVFPRA
jgi:signal transduction histidine kinase/ActR/RegA family two-component response regulator